jgi:hypothetical protein
VKENTMAKKLTSPRPTISVKLAALVGGKRLVELLAVPTTT